MDTGARNLTVVIKSSKLCNLRCDYCYEFHSLSDKARIPTETFPRMFQVLSEIEDAFQSKMKFCWHGGEPLLLPIDYYEQALSAQSIAFDEARTNLVQTNLYKLSPTDVKKLRLMDHVSISFDVFGDSRVSLRGENSRDRVVANMDKLKEHQINFGAITVLTKRNINSLESIFEFFNVAHLSCRILPYYREADKRRTDLYGLNQGEKKSAMLKLIDLWFGSSRGFHIYPIEDYIRVATLIAAKMPRTNFYSKGIREHVLMVDTNGDVYSPGTAYIPDYVYGNLFSDSAEQILMSSGRNKAVERSNRLISDNCFDCPFFGYCSGYFIGEQTDLEILEADSSYDCLARACIERALEWFSLLEIENPSSIELNASEPSII